MRDEETLGPSLLGWNGRAGRTVLSDHLISDHLLGKLLILKTSWVALANEGLWRWLAIRNPSDS